MGPSSAGSAGGGGATATATAHAASHTSSPIAAAQPLRAGERFVNLTMAQPYTPTPPNGGTDEYRCFLIDPQLTTPAYLTGSQFLPQNADIVHHAIFFRIAPADAATARARTPSPGEGWTCFGDTGVDGRQEPAWVGTWAPGANETLLSADLGYPMPPGSQLVMQIHYNLLATGGSPAGADQSCIRLRLTDGTAAMKPLRDVAAAGADRAALRRRRVRPAVRPRRGHRGRDPALRRRGRRPGGATGRACSNGTPVPGQHPALRPSGAGSPSRCTRSAGHMHLLGRSIKVELNPGTARARTLLDVPTYDFDDQALRRCRRRSTLKPGDTLRVTCTHDAGLRSSCRSCSGCRRATWSGATAPATRCAWGC